MTIQNYISSSPSQKNISGNVFLFVKFAWTKSVALERQTSVSKYHSNDIDLACVVSEMVLSEEENTAAISLYTQDNFKNFSINE